MKKKKTSLMGWIWKFFFKSILVLVFFSVSQVLVFKYIDPPGTVNMIWERLTSHLNQTQYISPRYSWRDLVKIPPHLKQAVLVSEDQRFLTHNGFDFKEIKIVNRSMVYHIDRTLLDQTKNS